MCQLFVFRRLVVSVCEKSTSSIFMVLIFQANFESLTYNISIYSLCWYDSTNPSFENNNSLKIALMIEAMRRYTYNNNNNNNNICQEIIIKLDYEHCYYAVPRCVETSREGMVTKL